MLSSFISISMWPRTVCFAIDIKNRTKTNCFRYGLVTRNRVRESRKELTQGVWDVHSVRHHVQLLGDLAEKLRCEMLLPGLGKVPGVLHFALGKQVGLVFFDEKKQVLLDLNDSRPKVRFQDKLDALDFHPLDIQVKVRVRRASCF